MLSIYAKLSSGLLAVRNSDRAAHMQGTVFTLAILKTDPTIKNLYHILCQCVDKLSSFV